MELKEEEKMLQVEETSGTEGLGAVSKPVTGTDQIITLDRLAAFVYENDNETDDLNWHELQNSMLKQKILTGMLISMERHSIGEGKTVNVALTDYQGYRVMIPVTEMNIILSEQDEGDMTKKIRITSNMIGCEIDFIVLKLDTATHSVVASRKKAMEKKVQNFYRPQVEGEAPLIQEGSVVEARILAVTEHLLRLECFGLECFARVFELAQAWMADAREHYRVGDTTLVRIHKIQEAGGKLSITVEGKSLDHTTCYACKKQGKYIGTVTGIHDGLIFIRLQVGTNAIAHSVEDRQLLPHKKDDVYFICTRMDEEKEVAIGIISRVIRSAR